VRNELVDCLKYLLAMRAGDFIDFFLLVTGGNAYHHGTCRRLNQMAGFSLILLPYQIKIKKERLKKLPLFCNHLRYAEFTIGYPIFFMFVRDMVFSRRSSLLAILLALLAIPSDAQKSNSKEKRIDSLMNALYERGQFTGSILIANHGEIVYKKAFGLADRENKVPFTLATQEYVGSISKQFTAMGIMILKDQNKLNYNQSIRHFFPELPLCMQPVTIQNLLYHTSGLALFADYPDMTEKDVFDILLKQSTLRFTPGVKFEYCNAGYSLLGMIIEKVSGQSLNEFMQTNIFQPLGMRDTEVNALSHRNKRRAVGYTLFGTVNSYDTFMGGNASIISTVEDLYKWDQSLYNFRKVRSETLAEAFTPSSVVMKNQALVLNDDLFGEKSYGLGWWITTHNGGMDMFHDGAFSGYVSYIERMTADRRSVICVSNLRNPHLYDIRTAIVNILEDKPYHLPKMLASVWLHQNTASLGIDSAIAKYRVLQNKDGLNYDFSENVLNSYAYILLRGGHTDDAIKVFELNVDLYPDSINVYDSLADGYERAGNNAKALESCRRALQIDPHNEQEKTRIRALEQTLKQ
jgi:CubicO group peptidase (beta-lactamase class C family)